MSLSPALLDTLRLAGVGVRGAEDDFFKENSLLQALNKRLGIYDVDEEALYHERHSAILCHIPGCSVTFESVLEFESHYNTVHRYLCSMCRRQLPSPHLLDLHISEKHDSFFAVMAERGAAYCCYVEECKTKFINPEVRRQHCIQEHTFPKDFRYDKPAKPSKPAKHKTKPRAGGESKMEVGEADVASATRSLKQFNFGHSKAKVMCGKGQKSGKKNSGLLEDKDMLVELKECLDSEEMKELSEEK